MQVSCDWTVAFFRWSKGVFQQAVDLSPEEAIAFEDSASGIVSAVRAGIPTVGIASTHDPDKLREAGAFLVCDDFTDPECVALLDG